MKKKAKKVKKIQNKDLKKIKGGRANANFGCSPDTSSAGVGPGLSQKQR
jgi:hypothetical protein